MPASSARFQFLYLYNRPLPNRFIPYSFRYIKFGSAGLFGIKNLLKEVSYIFFRTKQKSCTMFAAFYCLLWLCFGTLKIGFNYKDHPERKSGGFLRNIFANFLKFIGVSFVSGSLKAVEIQNYLRGKLSFLILLS